MTGRTFMQTLRGITAQIYTVENDRRGNGHRPIPIPPPVFDELTLIDYMIRQMRTDISKVGISINGTHRVTQACPADAVHPVQSIQALHDARTTLPGFP